MDRLLALALLALAARAQAPDFTADSTLVRLVATVKDAAGAPIGDLNPSDFTLTDSGVPQTIRHFERHTKVPLSVSLLIDTSLSTKKDFEYEMDSVRKFVGALLGEGIAQDTVAVYSFAGRVTLETSFTNREARIRDALSRLKPDSGTSLYDAAYLASRQIQGRDGRHILVIVTDGADTTSKETYQTALRALYESEAIVYPILVTPILGDPGRNLGGERVLVQFADNTGGRMFQPADASQLDRDFTSILNDLRTQYLLAFRPENIPPGSAVFHPITLTVSRPALTVNTRAGYYPATGR